MKYLSPLIILFSMLAGISHAHAGETSVADLQHDWAVANYQLSGDPQKDAFEALIERADAAAVAQPKDAGLLIWQGIIKSTYAGVKGGLGALKLAKAARKSLEAAIATDANALGGSAYASLGTLYYKVPGWPLGFGSDKKAVQLLDKALAINPDDIETISLYADYLLHKKEFERAEQFFVKAMQAEPLVDRPVADAGRRALIDVALAEVRAKLAGSGS